MGRPRRYKEPVKGPFDWAALAWSKESRRKARRGNRKAFWVFSNLWYKPGRLLAVIGGTVVLLLLGQHGAVRAGICLHGVGCASYGAQGIQARSGDDTVTLP